MQPSIAIAFLLLLCSLAVHVQAGCLFGTEPGTELLAREMTRELADQGCAASPVCAGNITFAMMSFEDDEVEGNAFMNCGAGMVKACETGRIISHSFGALRGLPLYRTLRSAGISSPNGFWTFTSPTGAYNLGSFINAATDMRMWGRGVDLTQTRRWICVCNPK